MRYLIGVTTCHIPKYRPKVQAQRETWVRDAEGIIDVRFLYGRVPLEKGPVLLELATDSVILACGDGYLERPGKIKGVCQWALDHDYDWVFKTDDDVYIDISTLMRVAPAHVGDYFGRPVEFKDRVTKKVTVRFASGFGYWLSRRAMQVIADAPDFTGLEDRWVAEQLLAAGITLTADSERYLACYPGIEPPAVWRLPATRQGAAFCEFHPAKMHEMHACNTARRVR